MNAVQHGFSAGIRRWLALSLLVLCGVARAQTPETGSKAPDFTLKTPDGKAVRLSEFADHGTVALIVLRGYPGYQCPYCVKQVHDFVENAGQFAQAGVKVLLVYPGPPADLDQHAKEFLAKQAALPVNVQLVTDPEYTFTNQYGLRWDAPHETAYPSTFLLNAKDVVFFEKISHGHGDRTTASDVLAHAKDGK